MPEILWPFTSNDLKTNILNVQKDEIYLSMGNIARFYSQSAS